MIFKTGMFLHAAAVLGPKGAILLLGHSSSGKTTLSSLLSAHFPVVADDHVFVIPRQNASWAVLDGNQRQAEKETGRYGFKDGVTEDEVCYPLHSLIRIFAAENTELQPLPPIKICEYLMDSVFEISSQAQDPSLESRQYWFHCTASMARQYKGWRLEFSLNLQQVLDMMRQING